MRISLKFLAIAWLLLLMIVGGLLYNAYSKLKPETFIAILTEQVQKNYPNTKLEVGTVDYGFSLDFNLTLKNIQLRRSGKLLGSIGEVELKVPWWLIFMNRGNAQINLSKFDIYIDHHETHEMKGVSDGASQAKQMISVNLPSYLTEARYTLRAKEISIKDIHNERRYFRVSKLLVREFQYGKNSAFELNIPIEITHSNNVFRSDLWLFGDVTPDPASWNLNYRGEFRTIDSNDKFQIEDLVINGKANFKPGNLDIKSKVELYIEKILIGEGALNATQEELTLGMNFTELPMSYFNFMYDQLKNPYLAKLDGEAQGRIDFHKQFDTEQASVKGKLTFQGPFQFTPDQKLDGKWQIVFEDSRWETSFITPKGEASFFRRSVVDMKKNVISQYVEELGFSGLDLNFALAPVKSVSALIAEPDGPFYTTNISYKKALLGEKTIDGNFQFGRSPDHKFYQARLTDKTASFDLNYSNKGVQNALDTHFVKFPWGPQYNFLAPFFSAQTANVDGKVEGRWLNGEWESGQWLMQLNLSELAEIQGAIPDFIQQTAALFEIDSKTSKQQTINVSNKNNVITLNSLMLENGESAKITGSLSSQPKHKSYVTLAYPKNKKWRPVRKEVLAPYWKKEEK
ncbi:hypothetical protein ACJVC5_06405 [Peredibacter sp. HCB2-198]|uniref:hypothetical protein n=1 Tax=Peredibacter sp. HCB2-198 TaxID=3383025 RepID=UPI0038B5BC16